jgi:hypothetical protein
VVDFGLQILGLMVWGLGFRVQGAGRTVESVGLRSQGLRI